MEHIIFHPKSDLHFGHFSQTKNLFLKIPRLIFVPPMKFRHQYLYIFWIYLIRAHILFLMMCIRMIGGHDWDIRIWTFHMNEKQFQSSKR